jgi:DNA-binding CsgD family transcriptional regulator
MDHVPERSPDNAPRPAGAARLVLGSRTKYLGLSALLAWHYCLWFVPSAFPGTFLLADVITFGWLAALGVAALTLLVMALALGRRRHLTTRPWLAMGAAVAGAGSTATFALWTVRLPTLWPTIAVCAVIGVSSAVLWVVWGECLGRQRAKFTMERIGPTYACLLLVSLGVTTVLPGAAAPAFASVLPLASGWLAREHLRVLRGSAYPVLLPRKLAQRGVRSILTVSLISFAASFVCYYTVAIVPWDDLWGIGQTFTLGIALGAVIMLVIVAGKYARLRHYSVFRLFPWLMMLTVLACVLFLSDAVPGGVAFLLALAISSLFEILLIMYMGGLTLRGYVPAATAFCLSAGAIRLGITLGNSTALLYERVPGWHETLVVPTFLVLVVLLTGMLITLVRQEYTITELASDSERTTDLDTVVAEVACEFKLSEREREVVALVGRGYTAAAVAESLVISQYTVNTHIQHIYDKMGIHKRAELIRYLHLRV